MIVSSCPESTRAFCQIFEVFLPSITKLDKMASASFFLKTLYRMLFSDSGDGGGSL